MKKNNVREDQSCRYVHAYQPYKDGTVCLHAKSYGTIIPTLQVLFIMLALKVTLFCNVKGHIDTHVVHDGLHVGKDSIKCKMHICDTLSRFQGPCNLTFLR